MSDQLPDRAIRAAFARLHATEQQRLVPPGVAAAHRTVRRRRATAATCASLAGVVALGTVYLSGAAAAPDPDRGPVPPAVPAGSTPPGPVPTGPPPATTEPPDPGGVNDSGGANPAEEEALEAVDFSTRDGKWIPGHSVNDSQNPPGSRFNTFFVEPDEPAFNRVLHDISIPRLEADSYLIRVWCGDDGGSVVVTLRAGQTEVTTTAQCAMTEDGVRAGAAETTLTASSDHEIEVAVVPDGTAWADGARPVVMVVAIPEGVELPKRPGPDQP